MTACASLMCDNCPKPGRCCERFFLPLRAETFLEMLVELATVTSHMEPDGRPARSRGRGNPPESSTFARIGLPFMPLYRMTNGAWWFWCPQLGADGRCMDYAGRPALCAGFEAGSEALCAMHRAPDPSEVIVSWADGEKAVVEENAPDPRPDTLANAIAHY